MSIKQQDTTSIEFLELATRAELSSINELLKVAGIQDDVDGTIKAEQLSRKVAEPVVFEEISEALAQNSLPVVAAATRIAHEANRARRDIAIATATHKDLMLGVYRTMYQRKLKLERKIQEEQYV
jgi:hypothetical protein